jgi:Flp pilus assembly pilin Flp
MSNCKLAQVQAAKKASLLRDERGLSTVEYVILMAIVVIGSIEAWNNIGKKFHDKLTASEKDFETLGN